MQRIHHHISALLVGSVLPVCLIAFQSAAAQGQSVSVTTGTDVKVTVDNNNLPGGTPTPSLDARNGPQNETSVAVSPANPRVIAVANNDFKLLDLAQFPCFHYWLGLNVSSDGGATWYNTMIPGFPGDTSPAGLASPLNAKSNAPDPVARFDAAGNLYVAGVADYCAPGKPDAGALADAAVIFVARYAYTPGSPAGVSTPNSAGNPPNFTYLSTTIVDSAPVGEGVHPPGFDGGWPSDLDKPAVAIDNSRTSPYFGRIYITWTPFPGKGYGTPVLIARSTDAGATFSKPHQISQGGPESVGCGFAAYNAIAPDGTILVLWPKCTNAPNPGLTQIQVMRSTDGGVHFSNPVTAATFPTLPGLPAGLTFRTPTLPQIVFDDTNSQIAYIAYMAPNGSPANADIFVVRSTDGGVTWGSPVKVNDDATMKHQLFPTLTCSHGALHVAWFDFRESANGQDPTATNDVVHVYYAYSNLGGVSYPAFSTNVRVSDVGSNQYCSIVALAGFWDYIEIAARFEAATGKHFVHVAWPDTRDIPPSQCMPAVFDPFGTLGGSNINLYADVIVLAPKS